MYTVHVQLYSQYVCDAFVCYCAAQQSSSTVLLYLIVVRAPFPVMVLHVRILRPVDGAVVLVCEKHASFLYLPHHGICAVSLPLRKNIYAPATVCRTYIYI